MTVFKLSLGSSGNKFQTLKLNIIISYSLILITSFLRNRKILLTVLQTILNSFEHMLPGIARHSPCLTLDKTLTCAFCICHWPQQDCKVTIHRSECVLMDFHPSQCSLIFISSLTYISKFSVTSKTFPRLWIILKFNNNTVRNYRSFRYVNYFYKILNSFHLSTTSGNNVLFRSVSVTYVNTLVSYVSTQDHSVYCDKRILPHNFLLCSIDLHLVMSAGSIATWPINYLQFIFEVCSIWSSTGTHVKILAF
jgi:hypothetical protein